MINNEMDRIFSLPLSSQAAAQLVEVQELVNNLHLNPEAHDTWLYNWGAQFSSSKAYKSLRGTLEASPLFKWLWSSSNLGKHKFFFWLLLRDRLNTRNILRRKNRTIDDYSCVLCKSGSEETLEHLFFHLSFQSGLLGLFTYLLEHKLGPSRHGYRSQDSFWTLHLQGAHDHSLLDHLEA